MNKAIKKKIMLQTTWMFLLMTSVTGVTYKLFNPQVNESNTKLIVLHFIFFGFAYAFSYFGYKTAIKKGQIK